MIKTAITTYKLIKMLSKRPTAESRSDIECSVYSQLSVAFAH